MPFWISMILIGAVGVLTWRKLLPQIEANKIRAAYIKVQQAEAGIDVALTKRYDTLTRSYELVNAYIDEETKYLKSAIYIHKNMSMEEMSEADKYMNDLANKLILTIKDNLDFKTNPVFKQTLRNIQDCEDHLQAARRLYNQNVAELNELLIPLRNRKVAEDLGIDDGVFFEANAEKKENVEFTRK